MSKRKSNRIERLGHFYNNLEVIDEFGVETKNGITTPTVGFHWVCVCCCGNLTVVAGSDLERSRTKSCGCQQGPARLPPGEAAFNGLYSNLRYGARYRDYTFRLSKKQVRLLTSSVCHYCGDLPNATYKRKTSIYKYNGIDRLNNNKGYTADNCVACCYSCNKMKSMLTKQDFFNQITKIYKKHCL